MNKTTLTHRLVRGRHLLVIAALVAGFVFMLNTVFLPMLVAQPTDYTISGRVTDSSSGSGVDGVTITFIGIPSGTETTSGGGYYSHTVAPGWVGTVTPSFLPGYTFTPTFATIGPVTGDVTQDFIAVEPGTIILKKQTEPPGGEGFTVTYDFDGSGSFTIYDGWTETIPNVPPGTYTITETVPANWDLTDFQCETDDPEDTSGLNGNVATIDLDAGETITCTFTNSEWGTIALHKVTDPPDGVTFSFASNIFGAWSFTLDHCTTLSFTVPAATYTVTETLPFGWSLSNFACETDDESDTSSLSGNQLTVDLDPGENITCTLTNSGWGTIFLHKATDPPGGAGFDFLSNFDFLRPPEFPLDPEFTLDHCTTLSFTIPAATYTITETLPVDWYLAGFDCETDDLDDTSTWQGNVVSIDLDVGETITCTINNSQYGSIVLRKRTVPPGGTGFEFTNPFGIGPPSLSINDGDTLHIPFVPAGKYSVTEADPTPFGFDLIEVDCEDPDGGSSVDLGARTVTIDLDAGETITCTFTNGIPPVPVGGIAVPVSKLGLVAPWLGLAALASLAVLTIALVRRRGG